jgi:cupin fold WbuC family metalloprotein
MPRRPDRPEIQLLGNTALDVLSYAAADSPRGRLNLNLHDSDSHPAHRFFNAMEPHSYVRPHRHLAAHKEETFVAVRGIFGILIFDEVGTVTQSAILRPDGDIFVAHIPPSVFHSVVAITSGSVFFEVKAGPYFPQTDKDWAPWAPTEEDPGAATYLARLRGFFDSDGQRTKKISPEVRE